MKENRPPIQNSDDELELDFLGEISQNGLDFAQKTLEKTLKMNLKMGPAKVLLLSKEELGEDFGVGDFKRTGISLPFTGTYNGFAYLLFKDNEIQKVLGPMVGEELSQEEWDEVRDDVLNELGNIVLNSIIGYWSNQVTGSIDYTPPVKVEGILEDLISKKFSDTNEVCFVGIGLFEILDLKINGTLTFSFYFDELANLLKSIKSIKEINS